MRFLRRSLAGVVILAVTLAILAMAGNMLRQAIESRSSNERPSFGQRERVSTVDAVTVEAMTLQPELTVFGELRSRRTLSIRSVTSGTVIYADPVLADGGVVTKDQLILKIDPTDAETALARVRVDLQDAQAELTDAENALAISDDTLAAAVAQLDLRVAALARAQDLEQRGVGTAASVETAELSVASSESAVLSSRSQLAQAQARVSSASTSLQRLELTLAEAERTLADTEVFAPFDGTLSDVTVIEGGRVTANELIGQLIDPTALEVSFRVSTAQYARLLNDDGSLPLAPVEVSLDVGGVSLTATGQITRESAVVAAGETGRLLFASLDTAVGFRPGDFVTVKVIEPELDNVALIPSSAVGSDNAVLSIGDDGRLAVVPVEVLRRQGDDALIAAAALDGQQIVAQRSPLLGAGIRVEVAGAEPDTDTAPRTGPPTQEGAGGRPETGPAAGADAGGDTISLDDDRRARLIAFVQQGRMPDDAKANMIDQLEQEQVPLRLVTQLESRMGG